MARTIRNYAGEDIVLQYGEPEWRFCGWPVAWDFFVPQQLPNGDRIGGIDPGIRVYESGNINWPGRPAESFPTAEEAKAYVEATWALEGGHDT